MRYLDPKNDLTFKKVFGQHPHLLKSFLNAMLPLDKNQFIEELEYLPAELVPEIPGFKNTIVDVRCKDNRGRQFIVEMQMFWTDSFKYRIVFNASKAYVKQLGKGQNYHSLQPVYALSLVNDIFEEKMEEYYHHYKIVNVEFSDKQLDGLEFVFVELPKFKANSISDKRLQVLWLRYLTEISDGTSEVSADLLENSETKEAINYLMESAFTAEEFEYYDKYWDIIQTERTLFEDSELKGEKRGELKGKLEVAGLLKQKGFSLVEISELTGISIDKLENL